MADIRELKYRTMDQLIDSVRLDMMSFQSAGDIDVSFLIKKVQQINYELGLRIRMQRETILEVDNHRAKLPADFHQSLLTLICHNYRQVQTSPSNGHVLLEQVDRTAPSNCPCWTVTANAPVQTTYQDCNNQTQTLTLSTSGTTQICGVSVNTNIGQKPVPCIQYTITTIGGWYTYSYMSCSQGQQSVTVQPGAPVIVCSIATPSITDSAISRGLVPSSSEDRAITGNCGQTSGTTTVITATTNSFCYPGVNGVFSCSPPCDICNVIHTGDCPELVVNPYPLGKCRTICNDTVNIKILQYCSAEVRCYEQFERLYIDPHITASAFDQQGRFVTAYNHGSIDGGFLYMPGMNCTKVYLLYLGDMEDNEGNLLVLDHPLINAYYSWSLKLTLLENLWMNGEDLLQKVKYASEQVEKYRERALTICNTPDFRQTIGTIQTLRRNWERQYYHPISRYWGQIGYSNPIDKM